MTSSPLKFAVLVFPGFPMMAFSAVIEPLRAANTIASKKLYEWMIVSDDSGGSMTRRMLPPAIIIPIVLGYIGLIGLGGIYYEAKIGISLLVMATIIFFIIFIILNAYLVERVDIKRKMIEQQLKLNQAKLQAILDHTSAVIYIYDLEGRYMLINKQLERQVLGLSSVISGQPSPIEATTIELCQIKFVDRESFLQLVERNTDAALSCARLLGQEIGTAFRDVHDLLLARSSTEKLARLLLSWAAKEPRNLEVRVATNFTHEEIAQMIGSSRETVTRLLSDLKRKELIRLEGSTLV